jgi:hypothetical protein
MLYALFSTLGVLLACAAFGFRSSGGAPGRRRGHHDRPRLRRAGRPRGAYVPSAGLHELKPAPAVSVVIPALNEAEAIGWVLERIPVWVTEVILVDGRSADATEIVARDLVPNLVVVHQPQLGKGAALRAGFEAARGDIIAMLDADGSTDPEELGRFVRALEGGADFVKGSRHLPDGGSGDFTRLRKAGNQGFVRLVNLAYGCVFTDLCYGYCAFWRRNLPRLALTADGFEIETELVLRALKAGLKISEVPSVELIRRAGISNLNAFRDGCRVLGKIIVERLRAIPSRAAKRAPIQLQPVSTPAPGSPGWRPAGVQSERRCVDRSASGYMGPERRRPRRHRPAVTVYRTVEQPVAARPPPAPGSVWVPEPIALAGVSALDWHTEPGGLRRLADGS